MLWLAATWFYLLRSVADQDLWWHMAHGRFYWENGYPVPLDAFTFSPVKADPFAMDQVLTGDLIFFLIYRFMGQEIGLQFLQSLFIFFSVLVFMKASGWRRDILTLCGALLLVIGTEQLQSLRNAIFTIPFLSLEVLIWLQAISRRKSPWWLLGFPLLFYVWKHCHGGAAAGVVALFFIVLGESFDQAFRKVPRDIRFLAFAIAALLVSHLQLKDVWGQNTSTLMSDTVTQVGAATKTASDSAGWKGLFRVAFKGSGDESFVGEYASPFDLPYVACCKALFLLSALALLFLIPAFATGKFRLSMILPSLATLMLGLGYFRTVGYPFLVAMPFMAAHGLCIMERVRPLLRRILNFGLLTAFLMVMAMEYYHCAKTQFVGFSGLMDTEVGFGKINRFRPEMPRRILDQYPKENIYNSYNIGGYLIWEWYLKKKVFIDGRSGIYESKFYTNYRKDVGYNIALAQGLNKALFSLTADREILASFMNLGWIPEFFDTSMAMLRLPVSGVDLPLPRYIGIPDNIPNLSYSDRHALGVFLRNATHQLLGSGRLQELMECLNFHSPLIAILDTTYRDEIENDRVLAQEIVNLIGVSGRHHYAELAKQLLSRPFSRASILAEACLTSGNSLKAIEYYRLHLQSHPGDHETLHKCGQLLAADGQYAEALNLVSKAISLNPKDAFYHHEKGTLLYRSGMMKESVLEFQEVLKIDASSTAAWYNLGQALENLGKNLEARAAYQNALKSNPALDSARIRIYALDQLNPSR